MNSPIDKDLAVCNLMEFLKAEGPSGGEGPVAELVKERLLEAGCRPEWICQGGLEHLPENFMTGNLIVKIPGTQDAPRLMFSAHLDTVPICQGAVPLRQGDRVIAEGKTGLGGDNRASVAALVTMVQTIFKNDLPHPPITLLFTVGEENGLHGAKAFEAAEGDYPAMCFNLDGTGMCDGMIGALGANRWEIVVHGKSVHAATRPEQGISSAIIASNAIAWLSANGWFGRIKNGSVEGTANAGSISGGEANNQVMDLLRVTGECRSHNPASLEKIISVWKTAFETAAGDLKNEQGECGSVEFISCSEYRSFELDPAEEVVQRFLKAAPLAGRPAAVTIINAGLDANILNEKGIPTLTFDAGNANAHAYDEYVDIPRYLEGCLLAVILAAETQIELDKGS